MAERAFARHDLLQVRPEAWAAVCAAHPGLQTPPTREWAGRGWSVMVRRFGPGDDPALLPCCIALPPGEPNRRIGFQLPAAAVASRLPPPSLAACGLDARDREALLALGLRHDTVPRLFGSVLWQAVTGLRYVTAESDVDLLWPVVSLAQARHLAEDLAALAPSLAARLDGELVGPDGAAVQWWEFLHGGPEILVKTIDAVRVLSREGWMALAEECEG